MSARLVQVIKNIDYEVNGSVRLEPRNIVVPVRTMQAPDQADAHDSPPKEHNEPYEVRIIESNNEYAIIEVTCGCGNKCHIQCNYADVLAESENAAVAQPADNSKT